jgi:peptidoglycan hydrolase-like protein with peptidoglycan-binding domain
MCTSKRENCLPAAGDTDFTRSLRFTLVVSLLLTGLFLATTNSFGSTRRDKRKARAPERAASRQLTRAELKIAEGRLAELGYGTGPVDGVIDAVTLNALVAFQKWEGRNVNGRLSRDDFDALVNAKAPAARDAGYRHVEVDLDRQVLLLTNDNGAVVRMLPVSSGSNRQYREKGMSGLAYTPRGRFRINAKIAGWRKSPLGLLFYPNYFSGGIAIHGNPSVPNDPQSHGCIRIPMSAAVEMSRLLPIGTIVILYDQRSFVSAKDWAAADMQKQEATIR